MLLFRGGLGIIGVMVTMIITGCGGSSSPDSQVTSTLKTYLAALANGKAGTACDQITGSEVQALEQSDPSGGAPTCVSVITYVSQSLGGDDKQALLNAKVINVQVSGDSATAQLKGGTSTAHFTKTGGHWYISGGIGSPASSSASSPASGTSTSSTATPTPTSTSTTSTTSTTANLALDNAKAARAFLKLSGYAVTPVIADPPGKGFEARKAGVTVFVASYSTLAVAEAQAASLKKGAAAGRGAVKQEGLVVFFALGSGSDVAPAVDAAAQGAARVLSP